MKKIITRGAFIALAVALAVGGTTAFFSDKENSSGNVFAAGAIDLKVDNDSYYNGNRCVEVTPGVWQWTGNAVFPVAGTTCTTSWNEDDLSKGHLFFDFQDLKPGDEGEDTISLHVQNDAWACMDLTLTSNDDVSSTEPELLVDAQDDALNKWDGELAQNVHFVWWADDGDNVLEDGENILSGDKSVSGGVVSLFELASQSGPFMVVLADKNTNVWGTPGPMKADQMPYYIAKAWCFGDMALDPVDAGLGQNPSVASGVSCDGVNAGNETQTDSATLDVKFRTVQARHNPDFICNPPRTATITVHKVIEGNQDITPNAFAPYKIDDNDVALDTPVEVQPGQHTVTETGNPSYNAVFSDDCAPDGIVNVVAGNNYTCTITNSLGSGTLIVKKVLANNANGPHQLASDFSFAVDGGASISFDLDAENNVGVTVGNHTVIETKVTDYVTTYSNSQNGNLDCNNLSVSNGGDVTCTVTNTYAPPCVVHADVMLVLDRSGSIDAGELTQLKTAAHAFVTALGPTSPGTHMGQSSFSTTGSLDQTLTGTQASIDAAIEGVLTGGTTDLEAGITLATTELGGGNDRTPDSDGNFPDMMVIITDGNPNVPSEAQARIDATNAANAARAAGIEVFVVGVGGDVDSTFLINNIADNPAHYFSAADYANLTAALNAIANCEPAPQITGTLTLTKQVVGGPKQASDFQLHANNVNVSSGVAINLVAGSYTITETPADPNYVMSFGGDADCLDGTVDISVSENVSCTVINTFQQGTLTVVKNLIKDNGGVGTVTSFTFKVDGGSNVVFEADTTNVINVTPGLHSVVENAASGYTTTYANSLNGNANCNNLNVPNGGNVTCTITNNDNAPVNILSDNFGTNANTTVTGWTENGDGTVASVSGGASPDGGAYAQIDGNGGYICRTVSTSGYHSLALKYYWRGDVDAENTDNGLVQYRTSGSSCSSATTAVTHGLDNPDNNIDEGWSSLQSASLPDGVTVIKFLNNSSATNEDFKIDGVTLTGIPN